MKNFKQIIAEMNVSIQETFKKGNYKLKDGTSYNVSAKDAELLNNMYADLTPANRRKMDNILKLDKNGFEEILSFAKEAD